MTEATRSPAGRAPTRDVRFEPNERPPLPLTLGLAAQYVLLTVSGIVLTPVLIVRAAGASEDFLSWAVFAALVISGGTTILQAVRVGRIGSGHILLMGTSGAFIAVCVSALEEGGPGLLGALVAASALFQFLLSSHLSLLRRIITPAVGGITIMLIAVTIMPIVFAMAGDTPAGTPVAAAPTTATVALVVSAGLALLAKGAWRLWAPVAGLIAGCAAAVPFGLYDTTRVAEAAWFGLPRIGWPGLDLQFGPSFWALLPVFILVTMVGAIETIGDAIGVQQVSWRTKRATDFRVVQGAVAADGLGNLLSGLACTVPNTTYSSSVAVTELTGVASRTVAIAVGGFFAILAFLPKVTALILAAPGPVIAAYATLLLAILFALGMRIAVQDGMDYRKGVVIGLAFWLGVGFQNRLIFPDALGESLASMLANGMLAGGCAAILMTIVLEAARPRRRRMSTRLAVESLPAIEKFVERLAEERGWSKRLRYRAWAATEESVLSLLPAPGGDEDGESRHLLLIASGTRESAELEFVASEVEENLEDRLAVLEGGAERPVEREFSLRLLRHYASRVRHQQFEGVDIVTLEVRDDASPRRR